MRYLVLCLFACVAIGADGLGTSPASSSSTLSGAAGGGLTGTYPNPTIAVLPAISGAALTALTAANITAGGTLPALNGAALTALTAANITAAGTLPALNGSALTALNATNLASGTVPDARFPATLPASSGVNLTALNGSNVTSGAVPIANGGTGTTTAALARTALTVQGYGRTAVSNAAASIAVTDVYVAQTGTMSAVRAWTLPAASAVPAGWRVACADESGTTSWWYTVDITPAGGDTINGLSSSYPHKIDLPYGGVNLVSDGVSAWRAVRVPSARPDMWAVDNDCFALSATGTTGGGLGIVISSGGVFDTSVTGLIDASHPGYLRLRSASGATDRTALAVASLSQIRLGGGLWRQEWTVSVPVLSTASEEFVDYIGFGDNTSTGTDQADGAYFMYDRAGTGVNWQCKTANGSTRTTVDSGTAVSAATFVKLGIEVNAAATSVSFYVNGVLVPTAGMPITTNIPNTSTHETGIEARMVKTVGTTATAGLEIDRYRSLFMSTTPR